MSQQYTRHKPWGTEEVLELNDQYCAKLIRVQGGHKLSLQYHRSKVETMIFIEGEGNLHMDGAVIPIEPFFAITIYPGETHRIEAITDLILIEASTPELGDVVRIQDDYNR